MKKLIFICLLIITATATAQKAVTVCGDYTYVVPENVSLEQAKQIALEKAQIQCIADEFGTTVSQSTSTYIKNKNGKSDISNLTLGTTEVNGEWLGYTKEPQVSTIYKDGLLVIQVSICGKIRRTSNSRIDIRAQILCNGVEDRNERDVFYEGDQFFMSFNTPVSGYLCVYLIDEDLNAYNIIPYSSNSFGAQYVEASKKYIFFSKQFAQPNETVDEYALSCSHDGEANQLIIIFSPNKYTKPSDSAIGNQSLQELSYENLQAWLLRARAKDVNMTILNKSITINKLRK